MRKRNFKLAEQFKDSLQNVNLNKVNQFKKIKSKNKKIRIGFVSGDLRKHPIGYFLHETLGYLKSMNLELIAFSNLEKNYGANITKSTSY